jgi:hypothetical protein
VNDNPPDRESGTCCRANLKTDERFDHEIVDRMGPEFYAQKFAPAVREARAKGETYESVRDRLRRRWKSIASTAGHSRA